MGCESSTPIDCSRGVPEALLVLPMETNVNQPIESRTEMYKLMIDIGEENVNLRNQIGKIREWNNGE